MENASKALLIAAGILMALVVLSIGVILFADFSKVGNEYERTQEIREKEKFNSNFTKFEGRTDITAQEIVTLFNFVEEYNAQNGTTITVNGGPSGASEVIQFLKDNSVDASGNVITFRCNGINYDVDTGLIDSITFN